MYFRVTWVDAAGNAKSIDLNTWRQTRTTAQTLVATGARDVTAHTLQNVRFNELSVRFQRRKLA